MFGRSDGEKKLGIQFVPDRPPNWNSGLGPDGNLRFPPLPGDRSHEIQLAVLAVWLLLIIIGLLFSGR